MIKIGLPKGIIKHKSLDLVRLIMENTEISDKKGHYSIPNQYDIFLLKHRDIPKLLAKEVLDVGITSSEWIEEHGVPLKILLELGWCNTNISFIVPKNQRVIENSVDNFSCVTEFPNITKKFINKYNLNCNEIITVSGSCEGLIGPLYDSGVDCVETGASLKIHNLEEEKIIYKSKVVVACHQNTHLDKQKKFINFVEKVV